MYIVITLLSMCTLLIAAMYTFKKVNEDVPTDEFLGREDYERDLQRRIDRLVTFIEYTVLCMLGMAAASLFIAYGG